MTCDEDGNLYLQSEDERVSGVRKYNLKGERTALFQPTANPNYKFDASGYYTFGPNGDLYQLTFPHEYTRHIFVYKSDGTYKSDIKLESDVMWNPAAIAVFSSGNMLIAGTKHVHDPDNPMATMPFAGLFTSDGSLARELKLEDDDQLKDMSAAAHAVLALSSSPNTGANHAVDFNQMESASDGNAYLMRWTNPAIFSVISAGGEVVRTFEVDPGDAKYTPREMHISGNEIAVLFTGGPDSPERIKVVDLDGKERTTYEVLSSYKAQKKVKEGQPDQLSGILVCFTSRPARFFFVGSGKDDQLQFQVAEPR